MISRDEEIVANEGVIAGFFRYLLRIISWLIVGLAIGAGQGIRENTREDMTACSLGGLIGGAAGGALFDPLTSVVSFSGGILGRALGDIVVGACIGGSMRLAQKKLVMDRDKEPTTFLNVLPRSSGLVITDLDGVDEGEDSDDVVEKPELSPRSNRNIELIRPQPQGRRKPLSFYKNRYQEADESIQKAFQSGHYDVGEIAEFFEVSEERVTHICGADG
jgi:hypothetical protein